MAGKRASVGRQKIPMAKIQKESHRQVTFSKRRAGLFKKASELSTLCGVEVAIIVFSPAGKAFSFGHPSVEAIVERYGSKQPSIAGGLHQTELEIGDRELNLRLAQVTNELEAERKRGQELDKVRRSRASEQCWWEGPVEELRMSELEQLRVALEELKKDVARRIMFETASNMPLWHNRNPHQTLTGGFDGKVSNYGMHAINGSGVCNFGYGYSGCF